LVRWSDNGGQTRVIRQWWSDKGDQTMVITQRWSDKGDQTMVITQRWLDKGDHTKMIRQRWSDNGDQTMVIRQWCLKGLLLTVWIPEVVRHVRHKDPPPHSEVGLQLKFGSGRRGRWQHNKTTTLLKSLILRTRRMRQSGLLSSSIKRGCLIAKWHFLKGSKQCWLPGSSIVFLAACQLILRFRLRCIPCYPVTPVSKP
jgi:hypothetical protein